MHENRYPFKCNCPITSLSFVHNCNDLYVFLSYLGALNDTYCPITQVWHTNCRNCPINAQISVADNHWTRFENFVIVVIIILIIQWSLIIINNKFAAVYLTLGLSECRMQAHVGPPQRIYKIMLNKWPCILQFSWPFPWSTSKAVHNCTHCSLVYDQLDDMSRMVM